MLPMPVDTFGELFCLRTNIFFGKNSGTILEVVDNQRLVHYDGLVS